MLRYLCQEVPRGSRITGRGGDPGQKSPAYVDWRCAWCPWWEGVCVGGGSFPPLSYLSFFCRSSFLLSPFHAVFFFYLLSASCGVLVLCRRCCVGGVWDILCKVETHKFVLLNFFFFFYFHLRVILFQCITDFKALINGMVGYIQDLQFF